MHFEHSESAIPTFALESMTKLYYYKSRYWFMSLHRILQESLNQVIFPSVDKIQHFFFKFGFKK